MASDREPKSSESAGRERIKIGRRQSKNTICACFCCDKFDGSRQPLRGTFIPHLSLTGDDGSGGTETAAPMRMAGDEEEWARRFDKAVTDLASIATQYKNTASVRSVPADTTSEASPPSTSGRQIG